MKPFVKWAGGKTLVFNDTVKFFPTNFNRYIEPFVGGGSVFLKVQPKKAVISDINTPLINTYQIIKKEPEAIMYLLDEFVANNKEFYLKIRDSFNTNPLEMSLAKAAEFIFLNKTCFNGLYRVNKNNKFNVPWGNGKQRSKLYDRENILEISHYLNTKSVKILNLDFREIISDAKCDDFIYVDPPYLVKEGSFVSYNSLLFSKKDYLDLIACLKAAGSRGSKIVISNSIGDQKLFDGFSQNTISRRTSISGFKKARVESLEYVYTNFQTAFQTSAWPKQFSSYLSSQ